jgi:lipoprotein signal peptidase
MIENQKNFFFSILVFVFFLLLDQYLKITSFLKADVRLNKMAVFSLLDSNNLGIIIGFFAVLLVFYFMIRKMVNSFSAALVISAISSNIIDRFVWGGVVDNWQFFQIFWFNLADLAIVLMLAYWLYSYLKSKKAPLSAHL